MKLRSALCLFICVLWAGVASSVGQIKGIEDYIRQADSLDAKYRVEKVYLHLDKPYYSSGQDLWFRAYVTDGSNKPSMLSKILYVDLISPDNQVVKSLRLPLAGGLASGDLALTDTLMSGSYRLRAYTLWMRNFGQESFFECDLKINNLFANDVLAEVKIDNNDDTGGTAVITYRTIAGTAFGNKDVEYHIGSDSRKASYSKGVTDSEGKLEIRFSDNNFPENSLIYTRFNDNGRTVNKPLHLNDISAGLDLKFFPEGGQLIDSIPSRVAFKALGSNGLGVAVSGYVEDSRGARVAEFKTEHAGMGAFMLTPFNGQKYTAIVTYKNNDKRIELPTARLSGYVMNLSGEDQKNLMLRITSSTGIALNKEMAIVVRSGSGAPGSISFKMTRQFADIMVPKTDLHTGVAQLTLFTPEGVPVAERLVFIRPADTLNLSIKSDKRKYKPREKVVMELAVRDIDDSPAAGSFSVSVTDISRLPVAASYENTILSELLLKSELKGHVEEPGYYFANDNVERQTHLNYLLMTQGWRKLAWQKSKPEIKFEPETGISIRGTVTARGTPAESGKVTLFSPDAGFSLDTLTDSRGRFNFDKLVFPDSTRFIVQARTDKDKSNVQIKLQVPGHQSVSSTGITSFSNPNTLENEMEVMQDSKDELRELLNQGLLKRTNLLDEVVVKAQRYSRIMKNSSKLGASDSDFVITNEKIKEFPTVTDALYNRIAGVLVSKGVATLFRNSQSLTGVPSMGVFLDGQYMGNGLDVIHPNAIAYIEVLKTAAKTAIYGHQGFGGVIIITSKIYAGIEDEPVIESPRGIITYKPQGYTVTREFYSPDYTVKPAKEINDLRSTIYWNPKLFTGTGKRPVFHFFTADTPGTYRAVIEGLDYNGRLGRKVHTFIVE